MNTDSSSVAGHSQITFTVAQAHAELVADFLVENLSEGFQELSSNGANTVTAAFRFYLDESLVEKFGANWSSFYQEKFSEKAPEFEVEFIAEIDWQERFRRETKAVIIADTILVRPTWVTRESIESTNITTDIIIDPKMAFGVGSHETTQLCMCALKETVRPGMSVVDVGCGSLILAILAAKLGAGKVSAVDNDPVAIVNAKENMNLNNVGDSVEVAVGSTEYFIDSDGAYQKFDIVVANIICHKLLELLGDLVKLVDEGGVLIISGLTKPDTHSVESAMREYGISDWSQSSDGDWVCYTCLSVTT